MWIGTVRLGEVLCCKGRHEKAYIGNLDTVVVDGQIDRQTIATPHAVTKAIQDALAQCLGMRFQTLVTNQTDYFAVHTEAHVCICFIAYKVFKVLERLIAVNRIGMSVDKELDAAKTITTIRLSLLEKRTTFTKTLPERETP